MHTVRNDDEALDAFVTRLEQFRQTVDEERTNLNSALGRLADRWRDQEHDRFVEQFESSMRALPRFWEEIEQIVPRLRRDAEALRRLNQHRLG